ncbi:hypothetical protein MLD38_034663 [Melastoma candidum]|uniref:Uncharacterized protein n=1 Tax=Melastoma candidum TaxID=119954 RepID=A0ACB9MD59_9MYRT|nr:hypothetical protein MLD38_034663 [Melastoma candidum]
MQTVDIRVKMDCDGRERRVKNAVKTMKGVKTVVVNRTLNRVTVTGYIELNRVMKTVKSKGKWAEFWPYISQHLVRPPYAMRVYNKRAPARYAQNLGWARALMRRGLWHVQRR